VTIRDPDANDDLALADVLRDIRVFSDTDRVGESFDADETGTNTGTFTFTFDTTSAMESGKIQVSVGDSVTIVYADEENNEFRVTITISNHSRSGPDCSVVVC